MTGTLPNDIRDSLPRFTIDGLAVNPPTGQLDSKLYGRIKEVLVRLGGDWKRGAFHFQMDPAPLIDSVLTLGVMPDKNPSAFFPTPRAVIAEMLMQEDIAERLQLRGALLEENPGLVLPYRILEPNAGQGAIADELRALPGNHVIDLVEACEINVQVLRSKGYNPFAGRFEDFNTDGAKIYDLCIMNPPFSLNYDKKAYITHILRAYDMLDEGGILIAVAPTSFLSNTGSREQAFYDLIADNAGGSIIDLPARSFLESGTSIGTCLITLHRTKTNWKNSPYSGQPNYFEWLFWITTHNDKALNDAEQALYENFTVEALESFVDDVLSEARNQGSLLPAGRRAEFVRMVSREYRAQSECFTPNSVVLGVQQGDLFESAAA
ncbi:MAG: DNA methyltransferase family protein [Sulfuricaulis sp.]